MNASVNKELLTILLGAGAILDATDNELSCKKITNKVIATKRPDLMIEWDFELNDIEPSKISPNSSKKANWICPKEHLYKASITKRNHGRKCNHCNCSWLAGINQRVRGRYACPKCKKTNSKNVNNLD